MTHVVKCRCLVVMPVVVAAVLDLVNVRLGLRAVVAARGGVGVGAVLLGVQEKAAEVGIGSTVGEIHPLELPAAEGVENNGTGR